MRHRFCIAAFCLSLAGCGDTVTNFYPTRKSAEADQVFEKGWLPLIIPPSSRRITTSNDLDSNLSDGDFYFDRSDAAAFLSKLKPYVNRNTPRTDFNANVKDWKKKGYLPYEYIKEDTVWVFFINPEKGHAAYEMWLIEREKQ